MQQIPSTEELLIETKALKNAALPYRAMNNKLRGQILQLIHQHGRITVTTIYTEMKIPQTVASSQLAILRKEGIVNAEREVKFVFYSLNYQRIRELEAFAGQLLKMETNPNVGRKKKVQDNKLLALVKKMMAGAD